MSPEANAGVRDWPGRLEVPPEPPRHLGPDVWSRRITREDRLVYRVPADGIDALQARYHG